MRRCLLLLAVWSLIPLAGFAQQTPPAAEPVPAPAAAAPTGPDLATQAVAAQAMQNRQAQAPLSNFTEHLVDSVLQLFDVRTSENTTAHYVIAAAFLVVAVLLRRVVTAIIFARTRKLAARTRSTFDDKLLPALEAPLSTAIVLFGLFAALSVLKLPPETDRAISYGATVAYSLVIFWGLIRTFSALLNHAHEIAVRRNLGIAAFMPWIKKTLIAIFAVIGVLMVMQSLGFDVKAILAGLGIGGLAFALAAQDTLANVFGSVVIAIDQPFKTGEFVQIGAHAGTAEDIGLRSTRLRTAGGNLIVVPNKTVAAEAIVNNSRFIRRRVDQVIGLTYDTSAEKMATIVTRIRDIIRAEKEVDSTSILVYFRDYNASSLDIWIAFNIIDPNFARSMELRQRVNLAIMREVLAQGLAFAFPSQTVYLEGDVARRLAARREPEAPPPDGINPAASPQ